MNVLSLFDGMSCSQIALSRTSIKVDNYFSSEIDKYCIKVTQENYPNTIQLGDIIDIDVNQLPKIDLIIGGSPCQDLSFASNTRTGLEGTRSGLFYNYVDILKKLSPKYFIFENVRMKKEWISIIDNELGVESTLINSSIITAQSRPRLYWANFKIKEIEEKNILLKDIIDNGYVNRDKSYCIGASYGNGGNPRWYAKGKKQIVFNSIKDLEFFNIHRENTKTKDISFRILTPEECEKLQTVPLGYTDYVSKYQRYKMLGNGMTVDVIKEILESI